MKKKGLKKEINLEWELVKLKIEELRNSNMAFDVLLKATSTEIIQELLAELCELRMRKDEYVRMEKSSLE